MKPSSPQQRTQEVLETMRGIAEARDLTVEALRDELNEYLHPSNKASVSSVRKWKNGSPDQTVGSEFLLAIIEWNKDNRKHSK
jgi:hypothetical protein